jgi:hypothetical protein
MSSTFLQAQRAPTPETARGFTGVLPPGSVLNLKDTAFTAEALEQYPWLGQGLEGFSTDAVQVRFRY